MPRQETVAIWRKGFEVLHASMEADEAHALALAMSREPLGIVCEAFAERPDAVGAAFRAISRDALRAVVAEGGSIAER